MANEDNKFFFKRFDRIEVEINGKTYDGICAFKNTDYTLFAIRKLTNCENVPTTNLEGLGLLTKQQKDDIKRELKDWKDYEFVWLPRKDYVPVRYKNEYTLSQLVQQLFNESETE